MDAASSSREATQAALAAAQPGAPEELRVAAIRSDEAYWDAKRAYDVALREYETTPEGQEALRQAIARLDEQSPSGAADARRRLDEALAARATQVADLAMARRYADRLAATGPAESAALDAADMRVAQLSVQVADLERDFATLRASERACVGEVLRAQQYAAIAAQEYDEESKRAHDAVTVAATEAERLYVEAGVTPRMAQFYAADTARTAGPPVVARMAWGKTTIETPTPVPTRVPEIKVKADGPDRDKTLAARAAAQADPGWQAATARVQVTVTRAATAKARVGELRGEDARRERRLSEIQHQRSQVGYRVEDATRDLVQAREDATDLRARIGSGLGTQVPVPVPLERAGSQVMRNPDGTTNAYIRQPPGPGFPHGRYVAAVDVTTVQGSGPVNALVLENGTKAWSSQHYARRGDRRARTESRGAQVVMLVEPAPGATPLAGENMSTAGFSTFVDTTD